MKKIQKLLDQFYSLDVRDVSRLDGFESDNYRIQGKDDSWVLKIYPYDEKKRRLLEAENRLLVFLNTSKPGACSSVIPNMDGDTLTIDTGGARMLRVLTYLEGTLLVHADHTAPLLSSLGTFMGQMSQLLEGYDDEGIRARDPHWDLQHSLENMAYLDEIKDVSEKRLVHYFLVQYREKVLPRHYRLRRSIIHNDANDWNMLVHEDRIFGLIDFGDVAYSYTIAELAVVCTYAAMKKADPVETCCIILKNYHQHFRLLPEEVEILYYLIAARLCKSLCASWHKKTVGEDTEYALVSEADASNLLHKWIAINPAYAAQAFLRQIGHDVAHLPGLDHLLERRDKVLGKSLSISYDTPLYVEKAAFQYMYERNGSVMLDAYNNIMLAGHCHPRVVEAGQAMMAKLNTNTRYIYDVMHTYAEKLLSHFPKSLNKVFFVNSGSEATDLAVRMARNHTGGNKVAVVRHGYHGNTSLGIDISHYKYGHKGGTGKKDFVVELALPNTYNGKYKDTRTAGSQYAAEAIHEFQKHGQGLAAFIAEPVVGCGGQVPLAPGYLGCIYPEVRRLGGLCISDEVQVGFGRLGHTFWGFEYHGVVPDMVILGKPMGNGHPIGAVITSEEIASDFDNGMEFFSSFGGNPVSCAIGLAVLEVIESEGLQEAALEVGEYLKKGFLDLSTTYPVIGDVRGSGLFVGVEIVKDPVSKAPHTGLAQYLKNQLRNHHILTGTDGPYDNVIKIKPPLCFSKKNVDILLSTVHKLLKNES